MVVWWTLLALVNINFVIPMNVYNLTYGFYIVFSPKFGYTPSICFWIIFTKLWLFLAHHYLALYFLLVYICFSHTAHQIDVSISILHAQGMISVLETKLEMSKIKSTSSNCANQAESDFALMKRLAVKGRLERVVEKTTIIQKWQHDVQGLLQITFMV